MATNLHLKPEVTGNQCKARNTRTAVSVPFWWLSKWSTVLVIVLTGHLDGRQDGLCVVGTIRVKFHPKKHCRAMLFRSTARPDRQCVAEILDGPSKLSVDMQNITWNSQNIFRSRFANQPHGESKHWSSADARFLPTTLLLRWQCFSSKMQCKDNTRRRFPFTFLLGILA